MSKSNYFKYRDHTFALRWAKKILSVQLLGGRCKICGNTDIFVLVFHHRDGDEKEAKISRLVNYKRWSEVKREVEKCDLLCQNCHAEHHSVSKTRYTETKEKLLNSKQIFHCEQCGYSGKNYASLTFHHKNDDKEFSVRDHATWSVEKLLMEIAKCSVLCRNCHQKEHLNFLKIKQFWELIQHKVANHKEQNKPVSKDDVLRMLHDGKSQIQIARELGCAKSTICRIVKLSVVI